MSVAAELVDRNFWQFWFHQVLKCCDRECSVWIWYKRLIKIMEIKRVEFVNSRAEVYDIWDRKVRSIYCNELIGYGEKGVMVRTSSFYDAIDVNTMFRIRMPKFEYEKRKWELHDDYLQVRC